MDFRIQSPLLGAGTAALVAVLAACQNPETSGPPTPEERDTARPALQIPDVPVPEGRMATGQEIARFQAARQDVPVGDPADSPLRLGKVAAPPTCIVDFNKASGLDRLPDDGYLGLSFAPHYSHACNSGYSALALPTFGTHYRLPPEAPNWCSVAPNRIGTRMLRGCINQDLAINWPRRAGTIGDTGVKVIAKGPDLVRRTFDLQAIYIHAGTAEIAAHLTGIGWRVYPSLTAGNRYQWPAGTRVSEFHVYPGGPTGSPTFDDLEIAIHP